MDRVRNALIIVTHNRIREALAGVLGGGIALYGLSMLLLPERHAVPSLERAAQWGGLSLWGTVLAVVGLVVLTSLPFHETAAPAIPLGIMTIALSVFVIATAATAFSGTGSPGAPWLFLTIALFSLVLSVSYSLGVIVEAERPPVRATSGADRA